MPKVLKQFKHAKNTFIKALKQKKSTINIESKCSGSMLVSSNQYILKQLQIIFKVEIVNIATLVYTLKYKTECLTISLKGDETTY